MCSVTMQGHNKTEHHHLIWENGVPILAFVAYKKTVELNCIKITFVFFELSSAFLNYRKIHTQWAEKGGQADIDIFRVKRRI